MVYTVLDKSQQNGTARQRQFIMENVNKVTEKKGGK